MNRIRSLFSQTAVYGTSSILGRLLNYLLVPIYTRVFEPAEAGVFVEIYTYIAFLIIILTYGLETAYFRFSEKNNYNKLEVYSTALFSLLATTIAFLGFVFAFATDIATLLKYPQNKEYIYFLAVIVSLDVFCVLPFARLRAEQKAFKFAIIKIVGIFINIALNLLLILYFPFLYTTSDNQIVREFLTIVTDGTPKVSSIFIANIFASAITLLLLAKEFFSIRVVFNFRLWKSMINYAFPLLIYGLAGIANETIDRILLKNLLPSDISLYSVGIYGMCFKIAVFMTIFIQAYRYAAEPFFFSEAKYQNAPLTYASTMNYFIITSLTIFLGIMLYIDIVKHFVGKAYHEGLVVVPILLWGHIFMGIFYNLSIWYKLTDKTKYGAYISLLGSFITILLNFILIPQIGYVGSAWANFFCYLIMMLVSYFLGKKYYPIPYNLKKIFLNFAIVLFIYFFSIFKDFFFQPSLPLKLLLNTFLFLTFIFYIFFSERKTEYFSVDNSIKF